tara:strand:- start:1663 stop:1848 length:186 start_codon:yes stop_codon:yes gene_type:complete
MTALKILAFVVMCYSPIAIMYLVVVVAEYLEENEQRERLKNKVANFSKKEATDHKGSYRRV